MPVLIEARNPYIKTNKQRVGNVPPGENFSFPFYEVKSDEARRFVVTCWENNRRSQLYVAHYDAAVIQNGEVAIKNGDLELLETLEPGEQYDVRVKTFRESRLIDVVFLHI